jgi:xylose dehydrogenase (NAD/NADP)
VTTTGSEGAQVESVRWGVLGAARIAREQVIPAIRRSGCGEVVAVSSASGRARAYADELGIPRAYATHEELLADPDVDAVYLPLPNSEHAPWIVRAAQAGKHVLCEKPLVLSSRELDEVEAAVAAAGVQLTEAFMYRHHPQQARVLELVRGGAVGDLVAMQARLHFALPRTEEPDIRLRPDLGGGALLDLGCYPVDFFGGLAEGEPDEVTAVAHRETPGGVDTRTAAALRYGDVLATLDCSFDAPMLGTATLIGTEGTITLTHAFRADLVDGLGTVLVQRDGDTERIEIPGDQYAEQIRAFTASLTDRAAAEAAAARSRRTVRTTERIARATGPA